MRTLVGLIVSLWISQGNASCLKVTEEKFAGQFKVVNVQQVKQICSERQLIEQKACVVRWELQVVRGSPSFQPKVNYIRASFYETLETGELCKLKAGMIESRELVSATDCCAEIKSGDCAGNRLAVLRCGNGPIKWISSEYVGPRFTK